MPSGNCLRVALSIAGARCGCIRPVVRFATSASSVDAIDDVERVDDIALGLRHLLAFAVAHQAVHVDLAERHVAHELQAEHDHARDPEEDDVEAGDQHAGRVEALRGPAFCSGQPSVENGHSAEENQVSSTSASWRQRDVAAVLRARLRARLGLAARDDRHCRRRRTRPEC